MFYIIIFLTFLITFLYCKNKNKNTINIIVSGGLSNRIRTILGYRKKAIKTGKNPIHVYWGKNKECDCNFYDIF